VTEELPEDPFTLEEDHALARVFLQREMDTLMRIWLLNNVADIVDHAKISGSTRYRSPENLLARRLRSERNALIQAMFDEEEATKR
jgi:hypothetical protein